MESFFDFGNKIVLIGGAGLGKSTTLNYLFCNYEKMYGSYALKLKLDLKEYAEEIGKKKKSILWCITTEFIRRIKQTALSFDDIQFVLAQYLDKGRCLIIFDALDEIPLLSARNKARDEIANFCEIYYLNRFILSTREAGYLRNRFDETFLHIKINQFSIKQIKKYSYNWYYSYYDEPKEFDDFWMKFEQEIKRARCENIISNPIILILALVIFDIEKNLPTRRIEFYQKCIETFLVERESRKAAFVLEDKTKSILAMNLTVPKIAYYKYDHLTENIGYKFNNNELKKAVYSAIGVNDELSWGTAVNQYIEYLVNRTELVQEVDDNIFDFVHKTFYEYFLAFYICKMYDNESLENLLQNWIGDANFDELARLIVESVIQNNEPRQHDHVISFLFEQLESKENVNEMIDIFAIVVDVYNHNMLQPKFYDRYNRFILRNSRCIERINRRGFIHRMKVNERVKYDASAMAQLFIQVGFDTEDMVQVLDTLLYLNNEYKRKVITGIKNKSVEHMVLLFSYVEEISREKVDKSRYDLYIQETNYFLNEGIEYLLTYPQIFLSVLNLLLVTHEEESLVELLSYRFKENNKFYSYTNREMLFEFIRKSQEDVLYFLLFLISIVKCLNGRVNTVFEYIIDYSHRRNTEEDKNLMKETLFMARLWKNLNQAGTYEEFKVKLVEENLFQSQYDELYEEMYVLYVKNSKGRDDSRIKKLINKETFRQNKIK